MSPSERKVVLASSLGTLFEWYDFFLYGALAAITSKHFFSGVNDTAAFIFALLTFSVGFAARPFGALVFGRLGDRSGRKHTFLITIVVMGLSTVLVGCLPSYASIGIAAPMLLVALRMLQGLALGGEYGGAAIYVAEHAPKDKRGYLTSWIQTMAAGGLLLSLAVIAVVRALMGEAEFTAWGWRIPFLLSALLLVVSVWVRMSLQESPVFQRMKAEGRVSKAPLREAYGSWPNIRRGLVAAFGVSAGQATVWYASHFYALFFLTQTLKLNALTANLLLGVAVAISAPSYVLFGALSDRIGRKPLIIGGCVLAALLYFPIFNGLTHFANPQLATARESAPVQVVADPKSCSFQFNPVGAAAFRSSCDIAKAWLAKNSIDYTNIEVAAGSLARVRVGDVEIESFDGRTLSDADFAVRSAEFQASLESSIRAAGYPAAPQASGINALGIVALLTLLCLFSSMTYAPVAAIMVELFPARIRYSGMSIPYHAVNGWIGGLLPPTAFALVAASGSIYAGLWYPLFFALVTVIVGTLMLPETRNRDIDG